MSNRYKFVLFISEQRTTGINDHGDIAMSPTDAGNLRISLTERARVIAVNPENESQTLWDLTDLDARLARYRLIANPSHWTAEMKDAWVRHAPDIDKAWAALRYIAEGHQYG